MKKILAMVVIGFFGRDVVADVVVLKNGKTVECTVQGYEKGAFIVAQGSEIQRIRMSTVESMRIGNQPKEVAGVGKDERLSLANCEPGKHGFLGMTLKVESSEGDRFIGSYQIVAEGIVRGTRAAVIQGVDTSGLISGNFVNLTQRMKCVDTETLSNGQTVYVFEPFQPEQRTVTKGEDPSLSRPVPLVQHSFCKSPVGARPSRA